MDKQVELSVFNPSSNSVQYVSRNCTITVPGHSFKDNMAVIKVPMDRLKSFRDHIRKHFSYIKLYVGEPTEEETESKTADTTEVTGTTEAAGTTEVTGQTAEQDTEPVVDDAETNSGKESEEKSDIPDREDFFAACTAQKESDGIWVVTLPSGKTLKIEGVSHHKTAKQAAYDQLYGES